VEFKHDHSDIQCASDQSMIHIAASNWPLTAGQSARALCNKLVHESRFVPIWDDQEMNAPIEARGNICGKCRKQPIAGTFVYALLPKDKG
jgi:hypothetical protein